VPVHVSGPFKGFYLQIDTLQFGAQNQNVLVQQMESTFAQQIVAHPPIGDMIQRGIGRIPSSNDDHGLHQYITILTHPAQLVMVSSAGITINANSMSLVEMTTSFCNCNMA
jgi:hypothetical protein